MNNIYRRALFSVLIASLLSSCALKRELEIARIKKVEPQERRAILDEYERTQNPLLLTETFKVNPIVAAVTLAPERIPEMIANGVDVNYQVPIAKEVPIFHKEPTTALVTAMNYLSSAQSLEVMALLLEAGADPNLQIPLCRMPYKYYYGYSQDEAIQMASLLLKYDANPDVKCGYKQMPIVEIAEKNGSQVLAEFLRDAQQLGIDQALVRFDSRDERLALEQRQREAQEAEQARQYQLAMKIRQQKKEAIAQAFQDVPDLQAALISLKESARPCSTLGSIEWEVSEVNCNAWIEGEVYPSPACENYQRQLLDAVKGQRVKACSPYENQRQQLAKLFGDNANIADGVIHDSLKGLAKLPDIEAPYRAEIRRMENLRDREARAEKAEEDRRYQQGWANLASHIEQQFSSKTSADLIIEQSVADTQRALYAIDNAQKMAEINADLDAINQRLSNIEEATAQPQASPTATAAANQGTGYKLKQPKVCAGPFSMPEKEGVYTIAEINSGAATRVHNCPANTSPVNESESGHYVTFFLGGTYEQEGVGDGRVRIKSGAYSYVCLCGTGHKTPTQSVSQ